MGKTEELSVNMADLSKYGVNLYYFVVRRVRSCLGYA